MKFNLLPLFVSAVVVSHASAGVFTIGGYKFDEKNTVKTAAVTEGAPLTSHSNMRFGRFSEAYVTNTATRINEFAKFDRSKSIAPLMGLTNRKGLDVARYISMPDINSAPPTPNLDRAVLELTWGFGEGLKNTGGQDFVIFEVGNWEGFAVAVQKAGAKDFTPYRYQFANSKDAIHDVNAVAFDLSDFGLAEGEMIRAIRIRNIFNSGAGAGADKVDNASGQGNVVLPGDQDYDKAFVLRQKPGGDEFPETALSADIIYVTALHDIEALIVPEPDTTAEAPAVVPPVAPATPSNAPVAKKEVAHKK